MDTGKGSFRGTSAIRPRRDFGPPRVLLADGQKYVRELLKFFLARTSPGCRVVGEAAGGEHLMRLVERTKPDLVIFNTSFPDLSFEEIIRGVRRTCPHSRLLAFGGFSEEHLGRENSLNDLSVALHSVFGGQLHPDQKPGLESSKKNHLAELTPREEHVLQLIAQGWATKEIADLMGSTVKSIARARERVMFKLDLHDAVKLTHYAIRQGLVTLQ